MNVRVRWSRGMAALALVLLFASSFMLMTAGVGLLVTQRLRQNHSAGMDLRCRYAAYSAVQYAIHQLNGDYHYDPGETLTHVPMPGDPQITYSLRVCNNFEGDYENPAPDGTNVPTGMVYLMAQGDVQGIPTLYSAGLASLGWKGDSMYRHAAIGTRSITLKDSQTDSYRTSTGAITVKDKDRRGTILTNSIQADKVLLDNSIVKGYCIIGPMGDPDIVIELQNGGQILPTVEPAPPIRVNSGLRRVPRYIPPYNPSSATSIVNNATGGDNTLEPGAYQSVSQTGGILRLKPGVYYVKDTFELNGGARLETDSSSSVDVYSSLYVGKTVNFKEGAVVNQTMGTAPTGGGGLTAGPMTLRIFFVGTGTPGFSALTLNMDNARGYFVAAGKNLTISLKNGAEIWGAVKGSIVDMEGSKIMYDKDLYNLYRPGMIGWSLQGLTTDQGDLPVEDTADYYYDGG